MTREEFMDIVYDELIEDTDNNRANRIIDAADEYAQPQWIPVSERLPAEPKENPLFENKKLELYLVTLGYEVYPFRAFWNGECFTDGWAKCEPIAWMPLPPVFKSESEE